MGQATERESKLRRWQERIGFALIILFFIEVGLRWVLAVPWDYFGWVRALPMAVAGALPWGVFVVLAWRRHAAAPWLALGTYAAALDVGLFGRSLLVRGYLEGVGKLFLLEYFMPALATLILVRATRAKGSTLSRRWAIAFVAIGALFVWVPLLIYLPIDGHIWNEGTHRDALGALIALGPLAIGVGGLALGRSWALPVVVAAIPLTFVVEVPDVYPTCSGPDGHPFAFGYAREFIAGCAALAVAPWLGPAWRFLRRPHTSA